MSFAPGAMLIGALTIWAFDLGNEFFPWGKTHIEKRTFVCYYSLDGEPRSLPAPAARGYARPLLKYKGRALAFHPQQISNAVQRSGVLRSATKKEVRK